MKQAPNSNTTFKNSAFVLKDCRNGTKAAIMRPQNSASKANRKDRKTSKWADHLQNANRRSTATIIATQHETTRSDRTDMGDATGRIGGGAEAGDPTIRPGPQKRNAIHREIARRSHKLQSQARNFQQLLILQAWRQAERYLKDHKRAIRYARS